LEIVLRKVFKSGLPGSTPMVQHLVLLVSMFGGAIAARENRLLSISTLNHYLKGRWHTGARLLSHSFAGAVSIFLCLASIPVVLSERQLDSTFAWGIQKWVVLLSLTLGYGVVGLRLLWHAGHHWRPRLVAVAIAAMAIVLVFAHPIEPQSLRWPALILLVVCTALGAPVFTAIGGIALILFWSAGDTVTSLPQKHYALTVSATLPSIPLFTLAGYFLAEGGAASRFIKVFQALFGSLRGGPAVVTVLVCAFFTSFTGASGVTILALGGLLLPILLAAGYSERHALGLLTAAGSLGLLFPPCLPPILYSIVASDSAGAQVRMHEIFQAGFLPGMLLIGMTAAWGIWIAPSDKTSRPPFEFRKALTAVRGAFWELLLPVIALGALFSGLATPVEAAAITATYAFLVETFIYRDLSLVKDVPRVMTECGLLVGGILLILGVALGLTYYLTWEMIPDQAAEWVTAHIHSKWTFLLVLNLFLLAVGCLMDIYSAIIVVVPLLVPIAAAFGIDMVHLGVIFLANLELGFLTPPVGMNLFISSYRFNKPVPQVMVASLPMLGILAIGVLLITYIPAVTLWFPSLFR
jgi:tripartite ATP-independent transporter DctM subunit